MNTELLEQNPVQIATHNEHLEKLFIKQLKDLHNAEQQLVKALPKLAKAAVTPELKVAFEEHLQITQQQVARLDQIFADLDVKLGRKKCHGMEGLIKEGTEAIEKPGKMVSSKMRI